VIQEKNQTTPDQQPKMPLWARFVALAFIVVGGMIAATGVGQRDGSGWVGFFMFIIGLFLFIGLMIWSKVGRVEKN
jgi:hypothetical protein